MGGSNKLKYEDVKNYIENESNSGCKLLSNEYVNGSTKLKIRCKCKESFEASFQSFKGKKQHQCKKCGHKNRKKKWGILEIKEHINGENGNGCRLLSKEYLSSRTKLEIVCSCGKVFNATLSQFKDQNKKQCNECGRKSGGIRQRKSYDDIKRYIEIESKSNCILLSDIYTGSKQKLKIKCKCGEVFYRSFNAFKTHSQYNCDMCRYKLFGEKTRLDYDYVKTKVENSGCLLISEKYNGTKSQLKIKCGCGNEFKTTYDSFINNKKTSCNECSGKTKGEKLKHSYQYVKSFIEGKGGNGCKLNQKAYEKSTEKLKIICSCGVEFKVTFNSFQSQNKRSCGYCSNHISWDYEKVKKFFDKYKYSLLEKEYINSQTKMKTTCPLGHQYITNFSNFLLGCRCPNCSGKTLSPSDFDKKFAIRSKGEHILVSNYVNSTTKIKIKRKECGHEWECIPNSFLRGSDCPRCKISKGEKLIDEFLNQNKLSFKSQKRFENLKSKRGRSLLFDFSIFDRHKNLKCLIEYDGEFHYFPLISDRAFEFQQENDQIKNKYCEENNIPLIRVPYWDIDNIETILAEKLTELGLLTSDK